MILTTITIVYIDSHVTSNGDSNTENNDGKNGNHNDTDNDNANDSSILIIPWVTLYKGHYKGCGFLLLLHILSPGSKWCIGLFIILVPLRNKSENTLNLKHIKGW